MSDVLHSDIRNAINQAHRILVISHIRPDGDAVGSVLGLGLSLQSAGKDVQMILQDGVPAKFNHLPGCDQISHSINSDFDLSIIVDCGDVSRIGAILNSVPGINIDHHITNTRYANLNYVSPESVSTTAMLAEHLEDWDLPLTKAVAEALLSGLITDSLGFRTSNMSPQALRIAAMLMEKGADLVSLYNQALAQRPINAIRLWGFGLNKLECEENIVWTSLTQKDRELSSYSGKDDADLINILATIKDSKVAIIFIEQENGSVKVSWRADPGIDISGIAMHFGGGGHPAAAGATIPGSLEDVQRKIIKATHAVFLNDSKA
jgi:bifunctional oligoribonuclease and PAP phosphatase NrnA